MDTYAAQRLSSKVESYLPVFGIQSTASVAYTGSQGSVGVQSLVGEKTVLVRVLTTSAAYLDIGANPNPSSAGVPIAANTEMVIEVLSGYRIGAIQQSSSGTLYVTKLKIYK